MARTTGTATDHSSDERGNLTPRQREILRFVQDTVVDRGYPPSVREIGAAVGLTSPSTVHGHLARLSELGYLRRDASKPRAIEISAPRQGQMAERQAVRHVPLIGDVAAGTGVLAEQSVEELLPLPAEFTGDGDLFMLRVRGESMIGVGIHDGDYVVVRSQPSAENGEIVVAGIPGEEATVKTFRRRAGRIHLEPSNPTMSTMEFDPEDVTIHGRVVTVLRRL